MIKKFMTLLSVTLLCSVLMTDTVICCENGTGIEKYDKKRDSAFITERMTNDLHAEMAQTDADPESEPLIVFTPIPVEYQEYKELELEAEKLLGIPESAYQKEDPRWSQGIVLKIDKQLTFVYCVSGVPVAFIQGCVFGDLGDIAYLATAEKYRGQGVGGKLLQHMITKMKERGVKNIVLSVSKKNNAAQHLYKKIGFINFKESVGTQEDILVYHVQ